jgi:hypothetical protein
MNQRLFGLDCHSRFFILVLLEIVSYLSNILRRYESHIIDSVAIMKIVCPGYLVISAFMQKMVLASNLYLAQTLFEYSSE